jgi:putative transposase
MNRSTYRLQKTRHPSNRAVRRILLADAITEVHLASRSTYGTRRMRAAMYYERGLVVNRKLIRRIMKRMSRPAWILGDGPEQLSYAATSSFGV